MNTDDTDGAPVRIPPPLVYLGAVLVGVLLHAFVLPAPLVIALPARIGLALVVALPGLWLAAAAIGLFRRTGQDPKPWKSTPQIVSVGVYSRTRNPMYVGIACVQVSIGVGLGNGWIVALVVPVLATLYLTAIRHEERYLERKFGDAYLAYKASVRRWI
jgi:protein-S-isoprenylcysteine O-methyltransferase Ste14